MPVRGERGGVYTPSFEPTVLKYPAEKPPVNAPCNLLLPFSSRTSCFHSGTNSPVSLDFSSGGRGVPIFVVLSESGCLYQRRCTYQAKGFIRFRARRVYSNVVQLAFETGCHGVRILVVMKVGVWGRVSFKALPPTFLLLRPPSVAQMQHLKLGALDRFQLLLGYNTDICRTWGQEDILSLSRCMFTH